MAVNPYNPYQPGQVIPGSNGMTMPSPSFNYTPYTQPRFSDKNAQGIANLGMESKQFGEDMWAKMMQGMQGAQSAYGMLSGPQADYSAYMRNLMGQADQPSASGRTYQDFMRLTEGPSSTYRGQLTAQNYWNQANQGQGAYDQFRNQLSGPGSMENWYSTYGGRMAGPSQASSMLDQYGSQLGQAGRSESLNLNSPTNLGNFAGQLRGLQGTSQIEQGAGEIGGYARGASDASDYYNSQRGALTGPGIYENFVTSDITGTNPLYERNVSKGLDRINQERARRGQFASGGTETAIGEFLGTMAAEDYQNRANRAQSAQQMELNRMGMGGQLSGASAAGKLAQGSALSSLAGQRDTERRARLDQELRAQGMASDESFRGNDQLMQLAGMADQNKLARLMGLSNMAQGADRGEMDRYGASMNAANMSDAAMRNRAALMFGQSNQMDQNAMDRARQEFLMGQGVDAQNMSRWGLAGQLAGQNDADMMRRLGFQAGGAGDIYGSQFQLQNALAGTYQPFYQMGGNFQAQGFEDYINATANALEMQGNKEEADRMRASARSRGIMGAIGGGLGALAGAAPGIYTMNPWLAGSGAAGGYKVGSGIGSGLG